MAQRPKAGQATPLLPAPSQFALSALARILNQKIGDQLKKTSVPCSPSPSWSPRCSFCNSVGASSCTANEHHWMITENHWNHWMITAIAWLIIVLLLGIPFKSQVAIQVNHKYFTNLNFQGFHPLDSHVKN